MKAIRFHGYGDAGVLLYEDAPMPAIKDNEVLIKIHAAGVNPADWKIREGYMRDFLKHRFPLIPGWDVAGTVEKRGRKVQNFTAGDAVWACTDRSRNGSYAEYMAARAEEVAPKPVSLSFVEAAGVPMASQTAWQALFDAGGLKAGQRVLIHAASGGVGHFAVQFAKASGAYVIGTASTANQDLIKSLGVDEAVDYKTQDFSKTARDVDLVLDTIGGDTRTRSWAVLRKGGVLVSTVGAPDTGPAEARGVTGKGMVMVSSAALLQKIGKLFDDGKIRVVIDKVFPLREAREAQNLSQSGRARGKIILQVL